MDPSTPRLPANYRVILDVVNEFGAGRHATAQEVFVRARQLRPGIGFTTVHRGLARLHELGQVLKLDVTGEGSAMYEPATAAHAHFRCTACGAVADVDYACDERTRAELEARHGVAIRSESITFTGLCRSCAPREHEIPLSN
jgi:Fur family transcriptional regulator, stress-responsive regulator